MGRTSIISKLNPEQLQKYYEEKKKRITTYNKNYYEKNKQDLDDRAKSKYHNEIKLNMDKMSVIKNRQREYYHRIKSEQQITLQVE